MNFEYFIQIWCISFSYCSFGRDFWITDSTSARSKVRLHDLSSSNSLSLVACGSKLEFIVFSLHFISICSRLHSGYQLSSFHDSAHFETYFSSWCVWGGADCRHRILLPSFSPLYRAVGSRIVHHLATDWNSGTCCRRTITEESLGISKDYELRLISIHHRP